MTREVANGHRADGTMLWRVSLATVDRDGPFSDFTGYKRIIMMLDGAGMTLDFGPHGKAVMDRRFKPVVFDGAWPTLATLFAGPTRDLNVVTAHTDARSEVEVLALAGELEVTGSGLTLLHILEGEVSVADDVLEPGDTVRLDGDHTRCTLRAADALVYRIDIQLAAGRRSG
jgi:environmental stress-induced protein Ves